MSENEKKLWRTKSVYEAYNVMIMSVDEPKQINDELTLCSFSFIDQSGNEKHPDTWVRVTGGNALAERIFSCKKGDRVNVRGKPYFRAYMKDGEPVSTVEIRWPDIDFLTPHAKDESESEPEPETPVVSTDTVTEKRKPGRPKKLPFQA